MIGSYVAGDSLLHRASPRLKLLVMLGLVTLLGFFPRWWLVVTAVLLAATAYPSRGCRSPSCGARSG
ncbi:hypothetical protein [Barrientosiimonas endolithica]|uniref:Cobalt/nickel transport system permease protein n=1 Tax=Barrientosiimonas endolithica TaxID=1535208 RepID=A0ABM8HDB6_9MICO|nr:hypothetical protein [Barrientosiimonas endolithica]BDZ58971.1 hypothetical protein GCM10025872_26280 [Barrientosiimonas endolithica]